MDKKELPTSGSGRSAFTVFGYGTSDRYADFDSPLENAANVESFNATNSIAFPSRPTLKSKKKNPDTVGDGLLKCPHIRSLDLSSSHLVTWPFLMTSIKISSHLVTWPVLLTSIKMSSHLVT
ncbi:hypothetical protein ElyMa_002660900 [Elysia marginata]|uniref:Uncharacterized protein n=1 Tax=Elysia marginata TaxID=1093978 RepID=A0AAV4H8T6_9GAST|nr:hypothetical protein ElyMa_002660900 [Elysia marginata]